MDKVQRILFIEAKDINWEANVWYLERFQFDATRYDPTRPVKRISFLDIADKGNREYLKKYVKYQLGVTGASVQNIGARTYITKAFLRFLDQEKLAVDKLTVAEIDLYMRKLQEENVEMITFNDKVTEIHCFLRFLTARGYYSKVPFYPEYYIKRATVPQACICVYFSGTRKPIWVSASGNNRKAYGCRKQNLFNTGKWSTYSGG